MGKEFKDWVDEFVENGANPKDVTNWPENGGGGQGGTGSNYLMTTMDYLQVVGKHIDVDSLIALLEKYQINLDTELPNPQGQSSIGIQLNNGGDSYYKLSIEFGYDGCSGGIYISIFNTFLENLEVATTFRTILTANKEKIESFEITKDSISNMIGYDTKSNLVINWLGVNYLTIQEALSIFK